MRGFAAASNLLYRQLEVEKVRAEYKVIIYIQEIIYNWTEWRTETAGEASAEKFGIPRPAARREKMRRGGEEIGDETAG